VASFSFIVPTHREDRPLARCLSSIRDQLDPSDEVIVVGDTHDGPLPGVEARVRDYGPQFRYLSLDAGHHCFGHHQLDYGISQAQGEYIHCNDDDDVWTPDAVAHMRKGVNLYPQFALLFRFHSYFGIDFWDFAGNMERNHIGGHCLVTPNVPGKVASWTCDYTGDFEYVANTVAAFGGPQKAIWVNEFVARARPT
jgi:GT2 family glycosyltransferase